MSLFTLVAALCVALLVSVMALARERRLRLALAELLRRIFTYWRSHASKHTPRTGAGPPDDRLHI